MNDGAPVLTARAAALLERLEKHSSRMITLADLQTIWAQTFPSSIGSPTVRADMAAALRELHDGGHLTVSKRTDNAASPALPTRVTMPPDTASDPSAAQLARDTIWRPELTWAARARLSVNQVHQLKAINAWLRDHAHHDDTLPLRERSLQILGHEKALDALTRTQAFAPGRLTLGHLRTYRVHPPLPAARIGDGPVLLVVENDNTYDTLRRTLLPDPGPVGHIAWGGGGAFEASVRSCPDLPGVERVCYFGDLDRDGLRIPTNANATALAEDLIPVEPATDLYRRLVDTRTTQDGQRPLAPHAAAALTQWLREPDLIEAAHQLLTQGRRIPQEALTVTHLRHT